MITLTHMPLLKKMGNTLERVTSDKKVNNHGHILLNLCKASNMFILNGRVGSDKGLVQFTFRQTSVIDYALTSVEQFVKDYSVSEIDSLYSDGHVYVK